MTWKRQSPSRPVSTFRPQVEELESRSVPAVIASFAAEAGLTTLAGNPALANANALLNNQLAQELAFLPAFGTASGSQVINVGLANAFQSVSLAAGPNAATQAFNLFAQESALGSDLGLLVLNPSLGGNPLFLASVNGLAASIAGNPLFATAAGAQEAFFAGAFGLNQQLLPFLANNLV